LERDENRLLAQVRNLSSNLSTANEKVAARKKLRAHQNRRPQAIA
jgi:hypothetical protein